MIKKETIITDSQNNISFLRGSLTTVTDAIYKIHPEEGKWSIQQILEHLSVTEKGVLFMGQGQTTETDRDPSIIIHKVRDFLSDYTNKRSAPVPVRPPGEDKPMSEFLDIIEQSRSAFIEQAETHGWHKTLDAFPHPLSGVMTRLEWLYFHIYHTERHLHQIKQIIQNPTLRNV